MSALSGSLAGCQRRGGSVAVVDAPSHELLDALHFATTNVLRSPAGRANKWKVTPVAPTDIARSCSGEASTQSRVADRTLQSALEQRASDIHIEPAEMPTASACVSTAYCILYRMFPGCRSRINRQIKSAGQPGYCEHRLPQDGQFTVELAGNAVSFVLRPYHVGVVKRWY